MENKLNEILELCIEKSNEKCGYHFHYKPSMDKITIKRYYPESEYTTAMLLGKKSFSFNEIDQALEYMQNE